jgi:hypothetical protein
MIPIIFDFLAGFYVHLDWSRSPVHPCAASRSGSGRRESPLTVCADDRSEASAHYSSECNEMLRVFIENRRTRTTLGRRE